ncbi:MAG: ABC transporter substrate-binding protein [Anaerolineales bacterium]|nr:ABC transporter substrate-binding protein [Anaerolineales bacterium]
MKRTRFFWSLTSLLVLASMVLSACGGGATPTPAPAVEQPQQPQQPAEQPQQPAEQPQQPAPQVPANLPPAGPELADAYAGKFKGTVVTMAGPFVDNDAVKFEQSVAAFEQATGIDIQYSGSKEFEASIRIAIEGGNAPDIVDFPQPGLLANFVKEGRVIDLNTVINPDWLKQNYSQAWLEMGTMQGPNGPITAGIWARANGKSLVWYPKKAFDEAGYKVPQTWEELMALTEQIAADGDTPWCVGIESGAATGWPMTDWIEETMLRTTSLENYDKWVRGELKFDSPEVRKAIKYVTDIWFNDKYVYGGRAAIATTSFGDAPKPMFENPPKCWLHKQGNFITTFFPEGLQAGVDYDFFYLPPIDPAYGKPVLGAGDIYAMFNDRPEVRAVIQFFSTGASLEAWVKAGGAIAPHKDASLDWYQDPVSRKVAEVLQNATAFRFDGSDLMPGEVGAGSFWKSMTSYVSGSIDLDTALKEIDDSWPR